MNNEYYKQILTPLQITKIEQFNNDREMSDAVRNVLLSHIYRHGVVRKGIRHDPFKNRAFALVASDTDNELLGANVRAWFEGVNALEKGFEELENIKSDKKEAIETPYNEAI
jgi:hypothetical protein